MVVHFVIYSVFPPSKLCMFRSMFELYERLPNLALKIPMINSVCPMDGVKYIFWIFRFICIESTSILLLADRESASKIEIFWPWLKMAIIRGNAEVVIISRVMAYVLVEVAGILYTFLSCSQIRMSLIIVAWHFKTEKRRKKMKATLWNELYRFSIVSIIKRIK